MLIILSKKIVFRQLLITIVTCFFCFGCTRVINVKIDEIGTMPIPLIEHLPLTVGVYYGNDFRNYNNTETIPSEDSTTIINTQLGKANIALFDYIFTNLFEKVIPLQNLPGAYETYENFDIIAEPVVAHYWPWDPTNIQYDIIFYMPGDKKTSWTLFDASGGYGIIGAKAITKHTQLVMRNIAADLSFRLRYRNLI